MGTVKEGTFWEGTVHKSLTVFLCFFLLVFGIFCLIFAIFVLQLLSGKSFCQKKTLAERGGTPPLNGKLPKIFLKKIGPKGLNWRFLAENSCFLADFFLSRIGGYPPHTPEREIIVPKQPFSGMGGYPHPPPP